MASDPGDHLLTMLEHDWVSDTSMTHLSFLLRHALFVNHPAAEAAMDAIRATETITESDFRGNPDLMVLCTGSAYEGVFPPPDIRDGDDPDRPVSVIPTEADLSCLHVFRKWMIDAAPVKDQKDGETKEEAGCGGGSVGPGEGLGLKRSCEEGQLSLAYHIPTEHPGRVKVKLRTQSKELSKFAVPNGDGNFLSKRLFSEKAQSVIGGVNGMDHQMAASMAAMGVSDSEAPAKGRSAWSEENTSAGTDSQSTEQSEGVPATFGFASASWPAGAANWRSRRRRHEWPETADVNAAMSHGCHLVATTGPKPNAPSEDDSDDIIWDISFSAAERALVCSLTVAQKKSYALLLTLFNQYLSKRDLLTSHHIKHTLLWTCEQSTSAIWREDNLAECLLLLLDRLLHFVCAGNLPDYFLPERNLLEHMSAGQIARLALIVGDVRRNPVATLNSCYSQLKLADGATYDDVFKPVLTYLETYPEDAHPLECIVQVAFTVGHVFLARDQRERALVLFEEGCELMLQICRPDTRSLSVLQLTAWLYLHTGIIDKAIEYYEIICALHRMEDIGEDFDFRTCLTNLACLYHVKSGHIPDETIQSHLIEKARGCFEVAFSEGKSLQVAIHYAMFLMKLGQTEKSVSMLVDAAAGNEDGTTSPDEADDDRKLWSQMTSFVEPEAEILDDDLGAEVREAGELELPTVILTQYLISKGLAILSLRKQVKESNKALARLCQSGNNDRAPAVTWALLGHCFKAAGDLHSALKAYDTAMKVDPYYTLAEDNYNICRAKLGKDFTDTGSESDN